MSNEQPAHVTAEEGSVWLRPWRVLLMGLAAVVVGSLLLASEERYQITDSVLASLREAQVPEPVLSSLKDMKDKDAASRQPFTDEVAKALSPQALAELNLPPVPPDLLDQFQFLAMENAKVENPVLTPICLLLMFAGLIAGGWAVTRRLSTASEDFDERVETAGLIAVFSLAGLIGFLGIALPWFSGRIFFAFFIIATIIGSLLVLLPRTARRLAIIGLALFHFGGIVTASTVIPPPSGQPGWLALTLWSKVYRPYLTGIYLTNAYHFYAPDPGSSTLVWLRIEYADGSYRWIYFPNRQTAETPLHYQRQMGICEATSTPGPQTRPEDFYELKRAREFAGTIFPTDDGKGIPLDPKRLEYSQYSPPSEYSMAIMASLARHMCRFYPHNGNPLAPPTAAANTAGLLGSPFGQGPLAAAAALYPGRTNATEMPAVKVKIYRLSYTIIMPDQLLKGRDPQGDDLKLPFFMGEFDRDGNLLRGENVAEGHGDPFLYWAMPMDRLKYHSGDIKAVKPGEGK